MENQYSKAGKRALYYRFCKALQTAVWVSLVFNIMLLVALLVGGMWVIATSLFLGVFFIVFLIFLVAGLAEYLNLGYKIDEHSLHIKQGLLSISSETIPFSKITNVSFDQSVTQRVFSVGDITFDQEDSVSILAGVDDGVFDLIKGKVSAKSNIQPVAIVENYK